MSSSCAVFIGIVRAFYIESSGHRFVFGHLIAGFSFTAIGVGQEGDRSWMEFDLSNSLTFPHGYFFLRNFHEFLLRNTSMNFCWENFPYDSPQFPSNFLPGVRKVRSMLHRSGFAQVKPPQKDRTLEVHSDLEIISPMVFLQRINGMKCFF